MRMRLVSSMKTPGAGSSAGGSTATAHAPPRCHYAVGVGYDLGHDEVVLRSGTEQRHRVSFKVFERTWRRGGAWAVAVLPPAELPATAQELPYLRTVTAFESLGQPALAATAYQAAARHWPTSTA